MKLFRTPFTCVRMFFRKRYNSEQYVEWVITETIDNYKLMYTVDTWYLPDFERILLGIVDYTNQPISWKSLNYWILYLGDEISFFIIYIYISFITTKSLAFTWQWHTWTENQVLSVYNWGVHLEDIEDNLFLDQNNSKLLHTHIFNFNNENSSLLIWEFTSYNFFFIFTKFASCIDNLQTKLNSFRIDSIFNRYVRFSFKVTLQNLLHSYVVLFMKQIIQLCTPHLFYKTVSSRTVIMQLQNTLKISTLKLSLMYSSIWTKRYETSINRYFTSLQHQFLLKPVLYLNSPVFNNMSSLLRKQRVFTKSKYSRSRQYCKNIVFLGLLLNIILIFGLNSGYYAILINTGYFIGPVYIAMLTYSLFVFFKFKLYNLLNR